MGFPQLLHNWDACTQPGLEGGVELWICDVAFKQWLFKFVFLLYERLKLCYVPGAKFNVLSVP